jgi:hypothetical protein
MTLKDLRGITEQDALQPMPEMLVSELTRRQEAVRRMLESGGEYHLSLGKPVTRALLHDGHRF